MKRYIVFITVLGLIFLIKSPAFGAIINVPGDQPTIQEGIDASSDGDIVLIQPGIYLENINFHGKCITLASLFFTTRNTSYISQTAINGSQNGSVCTIENT